MQTPPRAIIRIAKAGPPALTNTIATMIAGIATSTRDIRSERCRFGFCGGLRRAGGRSRCGRGRSPLGAGRPPR